MAMTKTTVFPDYLFRGKLEIPKEYIPAINEDIQEAKESYSFDTNFGWMTDKKRGLKGNNLKKVSYLIGNVFNQEVSKVFDLSTKRVDIIEPYLVSIAPGHSYQINIERSRWYNVCLHLQTTNKGSGLVLENFNPKRWVGPPDIADNIYQLPPKEHSLTFWPSYIPWGMSANMSMTDTILFFMTINIPNREK